MNRRPGTTQASTVLWQIRVTEEEDDCAKALAEYHAESFSDYVRRLITEDRQRLVDAGLRPPRKPRKSRTAPKASSA